MNRFKILVVDDSPDLQAIAKFAITTVGKHDYVGVLSGTQAVERAIEARPDVILLDVIMPDVDGPHTLTALKANPETKRIPVIFLTAGGLDGKMETAEELGAIGTIDKPFDPMQLAGQIEALLQAY